MMTIVLSACLMAEPSTCKDHRIALDGDMDTTSCAMYAPPFFAKWAEDHPGWVIKKWKCVPAALNDT